MKRRSWVLFGFVGLLLVLLGGTVLTWRFLLQARARVRAQEATLEQLPEISARQGVAQAELDKRVLDIQRIQSFLVTKDQIGTVVAELEGAAGETGVEMTVPAVEEKEMVDDKGKPVLSGPVYEVRLKIVATGRPAALVRFLHAAEHIQRLVYLESFRLDGSDETSRNQARQLRRATVAPDERPAWLTADMVVAVAREAGGSL